jgi:hypothetical protein
MPDFTRRHKFSGWPNPEVPAIAAGVYAAWEGETLIYCGMSGREYEMAITSSKANIGSLHA